MGPELRDHGSAPFKKGEIDVPVLCEYLKMERKIDEIVLNQLSRPANQLDSLNEDEAMTAFNALMNQQSLQLYVDTANLKLRKDIKSLIGKVHEATAFGKSANKESIRRVNKALLYAVYVSDKVHVRKYERFAAAALLKTNVIIKPLPPFFGELTSGVLVNLSAGGMALIMKERMAPGSKLSLQATFRDKTVLKGEVLIKHAMRGESQHIHGFEFVDLPNFRKDKFSKMAKDSNECDVRIERHELEVCHLDCSFYSLCNKPHKK